MLQSFTHNIPKPCLSYHIITFHIFAFPLFVSLSQISFRRPHTCGFLFSQLALNKSSLLALSQSGIINLLVKYAWQSIEYFDSTGHVNLTGNYSMVKTYNPPMWSIDPIDKIAYKPFVNLVRVTTSYECIENLLSPMNLLTNKEYYDFRLDIPTNLSEFFDRVIFVNNNTAKLHSLFNPDQCQVFGLRLLSCIISCLDSLLWFEAYLNLSDYLLNCQNMEEYLPTNVNVMYDALTIERNYLLMKIFFIGGPTERELPPRILCQHTNNIYPSIMIQSKPVYDKYYYYSTTLEDSTRINNKCKQHPCISWYNEMFPTESIKSQLVTDLLKVELINQPITSLKAAMEWINQCQTMFKNYDIDMKGEEFNLEKKYTRMC
uniref:Protein broad-minded n=1 Tax=Schistosoma haematobium TaxID=6185 RepID=A0A095A0G9_SCHHA